MELDHDQMAVWSIGGAEGKPIGVMVLSPIVAFWIGGVIEAVSTTQQSDSATSGAGSSSRLKLIAYASAQSLAGFFMYVGAFMAVLAL